jgi:metal-dependent amidase/aminoacylase/carboxypeptidase family protein
MAFLGTRTPGGPTYDLHQGDLRVDEQSVIVGAGLFAEAALLALSAAGNAAGPAGTGTRNQV